MQQSAEKRLTANELRAARTVASSASPTLQRARLPAMAGPLARAPRPPVAKLRYARMAANPSARGPEAGSSAGVQRDVA